jgi:RHS repeat-associated protein
VLQAVYDGDGRRIMTVAGDTTVYDYLAGSWDPVYVKDLTEGVTSNVIFAGGFRVGKIQAGVSYYYHLDRIGSVRLVTQSSSVQPFTAKYLPYGMSYGTSGVESFQYTGKQIHMSTTLYYYGNRYYDYQTGRFTSLDKHVPMIALPQTLNRYTYAIDNPNSNIDPDGKMVTELTLWELGGALGANGGLPVPGEQEYRVENSGGVGGSNGPENNIADTLGGSAPGGQMSQSWVDSVLRPYFDPPGSLSGTYSPNPKQYGGHLVASLLNPSPVKGRTPKFNVSVMVEVDIEFAGADQFGFGPSPTTVRGGHLLMRMDLFEEA